MNHITRRARTALHALALILVAGTFTVPAFAGDSSSQQRSAMQPRIVQFAYPAGSLMAYGLEISEDSDGDGVYDTRFVREHDGRWTVNCWPKACDRQIVDQQTTLSVHHDFVAIYNESRGIFTWELREYDRSDAQHPVAILSRDSKDSYTYSKSHSGSQQPAQHLVPEYQQQERVVATIEGATLTLVYDAPSTSRSLISIMNLRGRTLTRKAYTPTPGSDPDQRTTVTIALDGLPQGTHSVWVADETSIHATQFTLR